MRSLAHDGNWRGRAVYDGLGSRRRSVDGHERTRLPSALGARWNPALHVREGEAVMLIAPSPLVYRRPTMVFGDMFSSASSLASYGATLPLGAEAPNRRVLVAVSWPAATPHDTCNIDGVPGRLLYMNGNGRIAFWIVPVKVNTSGLVTVSGPVAGPRMGMATYPTYGLAGELIDFADTIATGDGLDLSVNTVTGGVIIGSNYSNGGTATATWTGLTKDD